MRPARSTRGWPRRRRWSSAQVAPRWRTPFRRRGARGTLAIGLRAARAATPTRSREFKAAIPILMAASRENADDDDHDRRRAARSQRLQAIVEAYIGLLAQDRRPLPAGVAGNLRAGRRDPRPLGAAGACRRRARAVSPRIRRSPSSSARSRTSASRSAPSSARSTTCCRCRRASATRTSSSATQGHDRQAARRPRHGAREDIDQPLPDLRRPGRSEAADGRADQGGAARRAKRCCRSISAATRASSGRCRRTARWHSPRSRRPPADIESQGPASCARRWSRRRR